jgi:hypothetical protein
MRRNWIKIERDEKHGRRLSEYKWLDKEKRKILNITEEILARGERWKDNITYPVTMYETGGQKKHVIINLEG